MAVALREMENSLLGERGSGREELAIRANNLLGTSRHSSKHVPGVTSFSLTLAGEAEAVEMTCPRSLSE